MSKGLQLDYIIKGRSENDMNRDALIRIRAATLFLLALVTVIVWGAAFKDASLLRVSFLNVGQGDAIFIEAPNGGQVLIDGGPNGKVLEELGKVMPFYDRNINLLIATHPDADHIGGFPSVLDRFEVGFYLDSGISADTDVYRTLRKRLEGEGAKMLLARRGMRIVLDEGVLLEILFPDRDVSRGETNAGSIVARLVYGETEFMLTGDAPKEVEEYLVRLDGERLRSDVLKAGHHGSKTSSSPVFLAAVRPEWSIVSAGKGNKYGHPHKEVRENIASVGAALLGTYESGTVTFTSNGRILKKK